MRKLIPVLIALFVATPAAAQYSGNLPTICNSVGRCTSSVPVVGPNGAAPTAAATGASRILSAAASTNATSAKASAGQLRTVTGYNARGSAVYLKFYNKASAPTVGTDVPVLTVYLPASAAFAIDYEQAFSTGIAYALTTGGADNDTGAVAAGDILGLNVSYN